MRRRRRMKRMGTHAPVFDAPAALNAGSPWEAVAVHFLQTDHAFSLGPARVPRGPGHQLPQVERVVVQQREQATLTRRSQSTRLSAHKSERRSRGGDKAPHLSRQEVDLSDCSGVRV